MGASPAPFGAFRDFPRLAPADVPSAPPRALQIAVSSALRTRHPCMREYAYTYRLVILGD